MYCNTLQYLCGVVTWYPSTDNIAHQLSRDSFLNQSESCSFKDQGNSAESHVTAESFVCLPTKVLLCGNQVFSLQNLSRDEDT